MILSLIRKLLLIASLFVAVSASAKSTDMGVDRPMSGTDYGESGDVDDHEESAVPLWMAGFTATNNIQANDTWLALRSQMNLQWDEPISNVVWLGSHNAFNSLGGIFPLLNDGVATVLGTSPNQSVSAVGQLNLGARLIEFDLWAGGDGTDLFLRHGASDLTDDINIDFDAAMQGMDDWLTRPENANDIIFLDFEDRVEQKDIKPGLVGARSTLLDAITSYFGSEVYLPADLLAGGAWPSRRELVEAGKRVIIFTHRNDASVSVFGTHVNSGQGWWYAGPAFLADGSEASGFGNFEQESLQNLRTVSIEPEDFSVFSAMQSDGINLINTAPPAKTLDLIYTASRNINFAKVDFIFGYQNDVDNGFNTPDEDDPLQEKGPFDTHPHRGNRLKGLVWSWAERDPAVQRQWFQDFAGAGTGADLKSFFEFYFSASATGGNSKAAKDLEIALEQLLGGDRAAWQWPALITDMQNRGAAARGNGRDYVKQESLGSNWQSAGGGENLPYILRSTTREPNNGPYRWKITTETGSFNAWTQINLANYTDPDGMTYQFGAPVNGFQNGNFDIRMLNDAVINEDNVFDDLVEPFLDLHSRAAHSVFEARIKASYDAFYAISPNPLAAFLNSYSSSAQAAWINVQDRNRDGDWVANDLTPIPPNSAGGPYEVDEGGQITLVGNVENGTIEWDLDGDNIFGEVGAAALNGNEDDEQPTFIAQDLDGPDTRVVKLRNKPLSGPIKDYLANVKVLNVAPVMSLNAELVTGPGLGGDVELAVVLEDPGTVDKIILDIDWDDGSPLQEVELGFGRETTKTHTYVSAVPISPTIGVTAGDDFDTVFRSVQVDIAPCELGVSWNDGTDGICHLCSTVCPAGTGAVSACSLVADVVCEPCPPGTANDGNSLVCAEISETVFKDGFELQP